MGRLVARVVISSAMIAPTMGPSWNPCAEKPKAWNTFSAVALGPITGMSSGMRPSSPAQQRTISAPRIDFEFAALYSSQRSLPAVAREFIDQFRRYILAFSRRQARR